MDGVTCFFLAIPRSVAVMTNFMMVPLAVSLAKMRQPNLPPVSLPVNVPPSPNFLRNFHLSAFGLFKCCSIRFFLRGMSPAIRVIR